MAKFKALPIAAAVATALVAMSASAVEFHGYFRAGFGLNVDGGSQVCYGTGGPDNHKAGRLGDECDMYAELSLSETVFEKNGEKFSVHTLVAYGTPEGFTDKRGNSFQGVSDDSTSPWSGQRMSLREAYGLYTMKSGTALWAGNRFYGRKDVHINDWYYVNGSGQGAGIENIKAGPGAIAVAVRNVKWKNISGDSNQPYTATPIVDLRYSGIQLGSLGSLDLIFMAGKAHLSDAQKEGKSTNRGDYVYTYDPITGAAVDVNGDGVINKADGTDIYAAYNNKAGYQLTAEWSLPVLGGFNKLVGQYSTEGFGWSGFGMNNHLGDGFNVDGGGDVGRKSWRVIDHGLVKFGKQVDLAYMGFYSQFDQFMYTWANDDKGTAYGATVRPMFKWNDVMSTQLEVGFYEEELPWQVESENLSKVTLAQAWSPLQNGGFWARPQLRLFVSKYAGDKKTDKNDTMFGAQVEAWW